MQAGPPRHPDPAPVTTKHRRLPWGRPGGILLPVTGPARFGPWGLHAALVAGAGVLAAAVAAFDLLAGGGRGAFIDLTGVLAALAGFLWAAYAGVATALVAWRGRRARLLALHAAALLLSPVLVLAALAAWNVL